MRVSHEMEVKKQALLRREMAEKYSNWHCAICGRPATTQVICRKAGGNICMKHCNGCAHYEPHFGHCLYREPEKPWKSWVEAESLQELFAVLKEKTRRTCMAGGLDDDLAYRVIDTETGEVSKGRVRFFAGLWHYGAFEEKAK